MARSYRNLLRKPDEFSLAGLNYLSFIIGGWIFSVIMVAVTHRKSEYTRFHAMQCLIAHIILVALTMPVSLFFVFHMMGPWMQEVMSATRTGRQPNPAMLVRLYLDNLPLLLASSCLPWLVCLAIAIAGMIQVFRGRDFGIPLVAPLTMRWFFKEPSGDIPSGA